MDPAPEIALVLQSWLRPLLRSPSGSSAAVPPAPTFTSVVAPSDPAVTLPALAALAAEALARDRTLWIVTPDNHVLPELANALDLRLRPLCLVLPQADYAGRITLRATLSLLKSRLSRGGDDSAGPAWNAQRTRLHEQDALWQAALAWSARGLALEAPPARIAELFPVRIGPYEFNSRLVTPAEWVVLLSPPALPRQAWPQAHTTLWLDIALSGRTGLVPLDADAHLRAEIEVLGHELAEMELELATAQAEVAEFTLRYQNLIVGRLAELDRLQAELARQRMEQTPDDPTCTSAYEKAAEQAEHSRREAETGSKAEATTAPFRPGVDLKKRFRQLAQKIHPDRAANESDRLWRTQLMSEANRAYRAADLQALDEVLDLWQAGRRESALSGAVSPAPTFEAASALTREAARIRQRLTAITSELDRLYGSKLYELFSAARMAHRQSRDLLDEMARHLDQQIAALRAKLQD